VDSGVAETLRGMTVPMNKHIATVIIPHRTVPSMIPHPITMTRPNPISVFCHQVVTFKLRPRVIPRNDSQLFPTQPILLVVDAIGRHAAVLGR
jgi:hypothetical protein